MVSRILSKRHGLNMGAAIRHYDEIPGPRSFPVLGTVPHYLPFIGKYDPLRINKTAMKMYKEFGPLVKTSGFGRDTLFLLDPRDVESVLRPKSNTWPLRNSHNALDYVRKHELKDNHNIPGIFSTNKEEWAEIRSTYQHSMSLPEASKYISVIDEICQESVGRLLDPSMGAILEKDFLNVISCHIAEVTGATFFGVRWNAMDNFWNKDYVSNNLIHFTAKLNKELLIADHGSRLWERLPMPLYTRIKKYATMLDNLSKEHLDKRMKDGKLISKGEVTLIDRWINDAEGNYKDVTTFMGDMLLASIDTTTTSLSFVLYLLSKNQKVQEKLYKELCALDPTMKTPLTQEILQEAKYLRKVVKESLRLFPVSVGVGRTLAEDMVLSGYLVPEGVDVVTCSQVISLMPEWVEKPDDFIPERYDFDGGFKKMHPFVSQPFGHGPRGCIGRRLAETEMYTFIFRMFRRYQIKWNSKKEMDCYSMQLNEPNIPLLFTLTSRTH